MAMSMSGIEDPVKICTDTGVSSATTTALTTSDFSDLTRDAIVSLLASPRTVLGVIARGIRPPYFPSRPRLSQPGTNNTARSYDPVTYQFLPSQTLISGLLAEMSAEARERFLEYRVCKERLGEMTAIRYDRHTDSYYPSNLDRGELLWCMIATTSSRIALEFGTGRGFGSLALADALLQVSRECGGTATRLDTVDRIGIDTLQEWPRKVRGHGLHDGSFTREPQTLRAAWSEIAGAKTGIVRFLTGTSKRCCPPVNGPYDLIFVDAGHDYLSVWRDLTAIAFAQHETPPKTIVFDDVGGRVGAGVAIAIARFLLPWVPSDAVTVVEMPTTAREEAYSDYHAMLVIDALQYPEELSEAFAQLRAPHVVLQLEVAEAVIALAKVVVRLARSTARFLSEIVGKGVRRG